MRTMSAGPPIAMIPKNKHEAIRIGLGKFKGFHFADVRVVTTPDWDAGKISFTHRGVAIPLTRLPAVIEGLQRALDEARRKGLFGREPSKAP